MVAAPRYFDYLQFLHFRNKKICRRFTSPCYPKINRKQGGLFHDEL